MSPTQIGFVSVNPSSLTNCNVTVDGTLWYHKVAFPDQMNQFGWYWGWDGSQAPSGVNGSARLTLGMDYVEQDCPILFRQCIFYTNTYGDNLVAESCDQAYPEARPDGDPFISATNSTFNADWGPDPQSDIEPTDIQEFYKIQGGPATNSLTGHHAALN